MQSTNGLMAKGVCKCVSKKASLPSAEQQLPCEEEELLKMWRSSSCRKCAVEEQDALLPCEEEELPCEEEELPCEKQQLPKVCSRGTRCLTAKCGETSCLPGEAFFTPVTSHRILAK